MEKLQTFKAIEVAELNAVVFVEDYFQLQFGLATITLGVFPVVQIDHNDYLPGNEGYRDKLCSQIGKFVDGVYAKGDEEIVLAFTDQSKLIISRSHDLLGLPELLVLEGPDVNPGVVW